MRSQLAELPARIAVTGSAGFLGNATVAALCDKPEVELVAGIDVAPTDIRPRRTRRFISITQDIRTSLLDVLRDLEIEAVVHLAFLLRPARDESLATDINVNATGRLLEDCEAAGVRHFVYLSSTTVYGAGPERNRPAVEDDPVNPVRGFQYSEHKAAAERLVLERSKRNPNMRACILRGCVTMAAGADNFITQAFARRVLPVPAGADPEMQFLHLDDYTAVVETALSKRADGIFNIAGNGTMRWRDLVRTAGAIAVPLPAPVLKGLTGLTWLLRLQNYSKASGLNFIQYPWLASTEKARSELGWQPAHSAQDAVADWANSRRE